ncbi:LysR family transcriptional regulator [Legionella bononiensis]|uniref:LysR family transcriptional regulator n=1 Tax=Legionella bononiensis TaxID=2793102 RepID=A0ABS1W700_9GAMM|nr:LysR family transcriptional regulator [Legionella bononiensis]MBL7481245.1 LysR family transcriptional regulator [Legionella bononiensis]MBL7525151.1 LysR family transcriptional regulator [Legionella bononiensis]MBL7562875.1 LysR family transcriptional regulator [Legionella bononiensis]
MKLSSQQLEAFAVTARTLNFSKAAQQLHITQSALSQRIQKLEERLFIWPVIKGTHNHNCIRC